MKRAGHVHVDRTDEKQWRASIARAAERVARGECVLVSPEGTPFGGAQLIHRVEDGYCAASDHRKDGCAIGF